MGLRGSKLSSANVQLQQCEKCKRSDRLKVIGKLSYCMNCHLGYGDRAYFRRSFYCELEIYGGDVFRGKFEGTVDVAVKRLHKHKTTGIITTVEPETLSVVEHPNIVRYYATEQDDDCWYIGMELCAWTLDDVIEGRYKGPPIGSRREVLRQIASALEYLHGKDIVHGKIDPRNVLISVPSDRESPAVMIKLTLPLPMNPIRQFYAERKRASVMISPSDFLSELFDDNLDVRDGILNVENKAAFFIDNLKALDIYLAGRTFGYFLSDGVFDGNHIEVLRSFTADDLNGDEDAFKLIKSMIKRDPSKRPTASQVLESIDSLKDCWNFAQGKLTGCDTCSDKPCRIATVKVDCGFATVFKGKFKNDSWAVRPITDVAIKRIQLTELRPSEIEAIKMLNEIKHEDRKPKNIVQFYVSVQDKKFCYIAMELCKGTLSDLVELDNKGETIGDKRIILRQIVSGLVHLHNVLQDKVTKDNQTYEVIHRDLNPKNILYTGTPDKPIMKLADFGLCRIVKGDQIQTAQDFTTAWKGHSKVVVRPGTDDWMAPEMHNANQFTSASDIFPLGLICAFTLAKGQHPFDDKHPTTMKEEGASPGEIQQKRKSRITEEDEAKRNEKMQKFTRQFSDKRVYNIIEGMLKKKPEERPNVLKILDDPFFQDEYVPLDFSQNNYDLAKENEEKLLKLCKQDQLGIEEEVEFVRLIKDVMDINCTDQDGSTPLMLLCKHRNADSILKDVQTLLTNRKDIDVKAKKNSGERADDIVDSRADLDVAKEKYQFGRLINKYPD